MLHRRHLFATLLVLLAVPFSDKNSVRAESPPSPPSPASARSAAAVPTTSKQPADIISSAETSPVEGLPTANLRLVHVVVVVDDDFLVQCAALFFLFYSCLGEGGSV